MGEEFDFKAVVMPNGVTLVEEWPIVAKATVSIYVKSEHISEQRPPILSTVIEDFLFSQDRKSLLHIWNGEYFHISKTFKDLLSSYISKLTPVDDDLKVIARHISDFNGIKFKLEAMEVYSSVKSTEFYDKKNSNNNQTQSVAEGTCNYYLPDNISQCVLRFESIPRLPTIQSPNSLTRIQPYPPSLNLLLENTHGVTGLMITEVPSTYLKNLYSECSPS